MTRNCGFDGPPRLPPVRRGLHDPRSTGAPRPPGGRSGLTDPRSTRPTGGVHGA